MVSMRTLIVEDDQDTLSFLESRLAEKCFAIDSVTTGKEALAKARTNEYDIILLDYSLPEMNGYDVCRELRKEGKHTPIIMISVTGEVDHKVEGFDHGIDDYVTKPFYFDELFARMQSVLRRPPIKTSTTFTIGDLILDTNTQKVTRGKDAIYLTRKEFSLLEHLMRHAGYVVSRGELMEHVWDANLDPFSNTIETHILNLRKKIDRDQKKKFIHSVPGRGYKIDTAR